MSGQFPILVVVIPLIFGVMTPLLGWWRRDLCQPFAVAALGLAGVSATAILLRVMASGPVHYYLGNWIPPWGIEFVIDPLNALMLVVVTLTAFLVAVYSRQSIRQELPGRTVYFYAVYLLQVTGFLGIVVTGDLFNLYVFLEITSLTGYANR